MIVVDCSVVVDALTRRELAPLRARLAVHRLHAPSLLDHEASSALRGLVLGRALTAHRATDALGDLLDLAITRHAPSRALVMAAWRLRDRVSAYDAAYVALAEALGAPFWTLDTRLARASAGLVEVVVPQT